MGKIIKVRIPAVTLEVDADEWTREYGDEKVREAVKEYFDLANCLPPHLEGIVKVL